MKKSEIVVIYKDPGKTPILKKIKNDISEFEKILGGNINIIPYESIIIVCKENRKNLMPNIYINTKFLRLGETIRGTIIMASREEQNFKTLTKEQAIEYIEFLKNASFHYDETIQKKTTNNKNYTKGLEREIYSNSNKERYIDNKECERDEVLHMILAIQTIILKFIRSNKN